MTNLYKKLICLYVINVFILFLFPKCDLFALDTQKRIIFVTYTNSYIPIIISNYEVNRFYCSEGEVSEIVLSREKGINFNIRRKNVNLKLIPIEKKFVPQTGGTAGSSLGGKAYSLIKYPELDFTMYIICGGETFMFDVKARKTPARTYILQFPYKEDVEEQQEFFKGKTYENFLTDFLISMLKEEIIPGTKPKELDILYKDTVAYRIIKRREVLLGKYKGIEFLIIAKQDNVKLHESLFFNENPLAVLIWNVEKPLRKGEMTRAFIIKRISVPNQNYDYTRSITSDTGNKKIVVINQ